MCARGPIDGITCSQKVPEFFIIQLPLINDFEIIFITATTDMARANQNIYEKNGNIYLFSEKT